MSPAVHLDRTTVRAIAAAVPSDEYLERVVATFDRVGRELGLITG